MTYLIGYLAVPLIAAFLITHFGIRYSYKKKSGQNMGIGKEIAYIVFIVVVFGGIMLLGR